MHSTIAGHQYDISPQDVARVARELDPEPVDVLFAIVEGRRFPPKQLVEAVTGLDRADFNSHQARSRLVRLGFPVDRRRGPRHGPCLACSGHAGRGGGSTMSQP